MSSRRARHRAPVVRFAWASRALLAAATVPVGALAGCVVAAVSSSADRPEVGIAGLAVAGVPLGVHGWRRTQRPVVRGRHAAVPAGVAGTWPHAEAAAEAAAETAAETPSAESVPSVLAEGVPAPRYLTVRLQAPRATAQDAPAVPRQRRAAGTTASPGSRPVEGDRTAEVAHLQRIWDSGTGPGTGPVAGDVRRQHAA